MLLVAGVGLMIFGSLCIVAGSIAEYMSEDDE